MFERFTDRGRRVLVLAQEEARLLRHDVIGTEHILLGLLAEREGVAAEALEMLGVTLEAARRRVEETVGRGGSVTTSSPPFTARCKKILELSLREALQLGHNYIGPEHLLLAVVREGDGVAAHVLVSLGTGLPQVRQQVIEVLSGYRHEPGPQDLDAVNFGYSSASVEKRPGGVSGPEQRPGHGGPRCGTCRATLVGGVAYRVLSVPPADAVAGAGPIDMIFVYCLECGAIIAQPALPRADRG